MTSNPPYHTLQRSKECGLASVCFALDLNYKEISDIFVKRYGGRWDDVKVRQPHLAKAFIRELGMKGIWFDISMPMRGVPDLKGRGVMTIVFSRNQQRHAVAFRDGVIHDSDKLYPMEFHEWRKRTARFTIDGYERVK